MCNLQDKDGYNQHKVKYQNHSTKSLQRDELYSEDLEKFLENGLEDGLVNRMQMKGKIILNWSKSHQMERKGTYCVNDISEHSLERVQGRVEGTRPAVEITPRTAV